MARGVAAAMVVGVVLSAGSVVIVPPENPPTLTEYELYEYDLTEYDLIEYELAEPELAEMYELYELYNRHAAVFGDVRLREGSASAVFLDDAEPPEDLCESPLHLDDRPGAAAQDRGDPICTEEFGDLDFRPVVLERSALTDVAVLAGACRPLSGHPRARVAFAARLARADEQLYDATFEWRLPGVTGRGVARSRDFGQPVAIAPATPLVAGVPYQWRVRATADPASSEPWSEWFPYTLRC